MDTFVTYTKALVKFMMGQKVINRKCHQTFLSADRGESTIIIPNLYANKGALWRIQGVGKVIVRINPDFRRLKSVLKN